MVDSSKNKMDSLSISVIIPVYNDTDRLVACLESLCGQFSDEDEFEIIVVDNAGSLSSELDENRFRNTNFIVEEQPGSYAARNTGIQKAQGDWLIFTDADCLLADNWWHSLKRILAETEAEVLVGEVEVFPVVEDSPNVFEFYDMLFSFPIRELFGKKKSGVTAHLIARRDCFKKYGSFDNRLFSGADNMWCRQAYAKGAKLELADGLAVRHPARDTFEQLKVKFRRIAGGRAQRATLHENEPLKWSLILRAFFPSFKQLKKIWRSPRAGLWLKVKASVLATFLRVYRAFYELCFKLGVFRNLERQ